MKRRALALQPGVWKCLGLTERFADEAALVVAPASEPEDQEFQFANSSNLNIKKTNEEQDFLDLLSDRQTCAVLSEGEWRHSACRMRVHRVSRGVRRMTGDRALDVKR
jgi:hypothetical protein